MRSEEEQTQAQTTQSTIQSAAQSQAQTTQSTIQSAAQSQSL